MKVKRMIAALSVIAALALAALGILWYKNEKGYVEVTDKADSFPIRAKSAGKNPQLAESDGPYAIVHTTAGDITILLYPEQAPKAVENFIGLAREGYYDGSSFYYVKRDTAVQGGRPAAYDAFVKTDAAAKGETPPEDIKERSFFGDPFEDEFSDELHNFPGAVGMAGAAVNQDANKSQFYFQLEKTKPEDEIVIPANFYMNELIYRRMKEFREKDSANAMTEEEIQTFEDALNEEIQRIGTEGVPQNEQERYAPAVEKYKQVGGSWSKDYKYTVFGQIVKGLNVAQAMSEVLVNAADRSPKKPILINSIEIVDSLR